MSENMTIYEEKKRGTPLQSHFHFSPFTLHSTHLFQHFLFLFRLPTSYLEVDKKVMACGGIS